MTIEKLSAGLTYDEIAARLGISRVRVIQIEATALRKLRIALAAKGVHSFDGRELRASDS